MPFPLSSRPGAAASRVLVPASLLLVLVGCREEAVEVEVPEAGGRELAARSASEGTRFVDLDPERSGVQLHNAFDWDHPLARLYQHGWAGGGVAVGDYDADGLADLYLTSQTAADRLYRQVSPLVFEDATSSAGLSDEAAWSAGAAFSDLDGDGHLDLYVCRYDAPNLYYRNTGSGGFEEIAAEVGLDHRGASVMAAFADIDHDGDLDLFLLTNRLYPGPALDQPRTEHVQGKVRLVPGQEDMHALQEREIDGEVQKFIVKAGERDLLFRNDGGSFTEVGREAGIEGHHPGLSATFWDADHDGWADLYVGNDFWDPDFLYLNRRDGTFEDVTAERLPHTPWFSMGADFADVDGDGRMDLLAADMAPTTHFMSKLMMGDMDDSRWFLESAEPRQYMRNALYLGTGTPRFREGAFQYGVASTDWTWSVCFGDLDLDGCQDLLVTNGTANHSFDPDLTRRMRTRAMQLERAGVRDPVQLYQAQWELYREVPPRAERNLAFRGSAGGGFEPVGEQWGLAHEGISFGAVLADLDRDGDLDAVVNDVGDRARVFENRSAGGHALLLRLVAEGRNTFGVGAEVRVRAGGEEWLRQLYPTRGYASAREPLVHVGLGQAARADVLVRWPSGLQTELKAVEADRLLVVREGDGAVRPPVEEALMPVLALAPGRLGTAAVGAPERPFDDFGDQPLLPQRLSTPGSPLAVGDVDGDGDDDLFLGGSAGQAGRLFLQVAGRLEAHAVPALEEDRASEDTAAVWLDADGDGDQDLFVTSGSVEWERGADELADRLYLGDGQGGLVRAPELVPRACESSSTVAAGDVDGDGDRDLFVGVRCIPGEYPRAGRSRLLINTGGSFVDATDERAPGLAAAGLVTAATWADVDGDEDVDLVLARDWASPSIWMNSGGVLVDSSIACGIAALSGWWGGVCAAHLDADEHLDLVFTGVGWNTKYHADEAHPALMYAGDFRGDGSLRLIEAKCAEGELPVRGLSCSSAAIPVVRLRTPTFRSFASSTLTDIYGDRLEQSERLEVAHLGHVVLYGSEAGSFEARPLPWDAQLAPAHAVLAHDLDGDGLQDLMLAQNFFGREPETGRWDGGLGQVLLGDGARGWRALGPQLAGVLAPGEGRALATITLGSEELVLLTRVGEGTLAWMVR